MKIAILRRRFSATGGAELYVQRLLNSLTSRNHEVHLFAEEWEGQSDEVKFHKIASEGNRARRPWSFAEEAQRMISKDSFDCVFSLERTLKQDVYRAGDGLHARWVEIRKKHAPAWKRWLTARGAFHKSMMDLELQTLSPENTGHVIANSTMVADEIVRHTSFPRERIHVVPNGVEIERFRSGKREATRESWGLSPKDKVILFVGSGWERKGLAALIEAFHMTTEEAYLCVVGKGKWKWGRSPHIKHIGPMQNVEDAYAAADLVVLPALYEPCSNVVSEAFVAGVPVITTSTNGASELIQPGINGDIVQEASDVPELSALVNKWLDIVPRKVKDDLDVLSMDRNVDETIRVLEQAASEKGAKA